MQLGMRSYALMLVVQLTILVPLSPVLPVWLWLTALATAVWYWQIFRGRLGLPGVQVLWLAGCMAMAGIAVSYPTPLAIEPMVALAVIAFMFKQLEMRTARDLWVLIFVAWFLVACNLLFQQGLSAVSVVAAQVFTLLLLQQSLYRQVSAGRLSSSAFALMLQSLPIMLFLFLVFPRIGPLWLMPGAEREAISGLSESMQPGEVERLVRSGELAFRVEFDGEIPAQGELYWRALVLENFDGKRWTRNEDFLGVGQSLVTKQSPLSYQVTVEPGFHRWLPTLAPALVPQSSAYVSLNQEWQLKRPEQRRLGYRAYSKPSSFLRASAGYWVQARNLRVPERGNAKARALAEQWRSLGDVEAIIDAAASWFRARPFTYTLSPPRLEGERIDQFLFSEQAGFCEHYAGAFVYLMRAAGVPARMVVGYQGGERSPNGDYLLVHQSDAHAWAEVLHPEFGWQRVDPVSYVAPDRILLESSEFFADEQNFLADAGMSLRRFAVFEQLRLWLDAADYAWAKWVLDYNSGRQFSLLGDFLRNWGALKLALGFVMAGLIPMALVLLYNRRGSQSRRQDPLVRAYSRCIQRLSRFGLERKTSETPGDYALRVAESAPELSAWIKQVTTAYEYAAYRRPGTERAMLRRLNRLRRAPLSDKRIGSRIEQWFRRQFFTGAKR